MQRVLVLCTGNSCRSVLAEALFNQLGKDKYIAVSAGSKPAGYIHAKSIETLNRHGINPGNLLLARSYLPLEVISELEKNGRVVDTLILERESLEYEQAKLLAGVVN